MGGADCQIGGRARPCGGIGGSHHDGHGHHGHWHHEHGYDGYSHLDDCHHDHRHNHDGYNEHARAAVLVTSLADNAQFL
jgi:hypothetical protein